MKEHSTTHPGGFITGHCSVVSWNKDKKSMETRPGYIWEDLTSHFLLMDLKKLTIVAVPTVSKIILRTHGFLTDCVSICFFTLWFNTNLNEAIINKYIIFLKKKKKKGQHDI